jgi:hypothetical protein
MWEKVFKILFYFLKMDKNKCPKMFLKKKFKKRGSLPFFIHVFIKKIKSSQKNIVVVAAS